VDEQQRTLTRGALLSKLAAAPIAIGALAALQAEAEAGTKAGSGSKAALKYQPTPNHGSQCSQCRFYINGKTKTSNGECTQVAGSISPKGWCLAFSKGDNSKQTM
jgi:High potential iron-sulfur protein